MRTSPWLTEQLELAGKTAPYFHALSRPAAVEREGTHRAITMAEIVDVPILLVHVSSAEAVEQIRWAQGRGLRIYAETCPQYLVLTAEHLDAPDFEGAKYVCSPPPSDAASQRAVWNGLATGPNGVPGVETRLPLLFSEGWARAGSTCRPSWP